MFPPEHTTENTPYSEEEFQFQSGDITLHGTLTIPQGQGPHPGVVLMSGSGPNGRDSEAFGFKMFRLVADYLSRNGIAVLRHDDRGFGDPSQDYGWRYTSQDFAECTVAAVNALERHSDIDCERIGLIGHSEGARMAPWVASQSKHVAFIIFLAGCCLTGEDNFYIERKAWGQAEGETEEEIAEALAWLKRLFAAVHTGQGWNAIRIDARKNAAKAFEKLPEDIRTKFSGVDAYLPTTFEGIVLQMASTRWFKFFLDYDPLPFFKEVARPMLVLFGELDTIIPPSEHQELIASALKQGGSQDITVKVIPKANHFFLASETGSWSELQTMKKEFAPGFLNITTDWILRRFGTRTKGL